MTTEALARAAIEVRERAYAPYSGYKVGAALVDDEERLFTGCNVENVSFGATICAERGAIAQMVAAGARHPRAIAVATADGGTPCGICLQVLAEFGQDLQVVLLAGDRVVRECRLGDLFPAAFRSAQVRQSGA